MITEYVLFKLPAGITREQVVENYEKTVAKWSANKDLVRKNYLYDGENGWGGGVYMWKTLEAAKAGHNEAWKQYIRDLYGSEPQVRYFDTPMVQDNLVHQTFTFEPEAALA
ncbi:MAG: hypothetical protein AB7O31_05090 [Burkholderiales bacterium]